jgi:hypothetical protein
MMPRHVTVDCADPHELATFWSAATGWPLSELDHRTAEGPGWVTLQNPEGNEFCIERSDAERAG